MARKYSRFTGADVMQKYNIERIAVTINSRAHRVMFDTGKITLSPEEFTKTYHEPPKDTTKDTYNVSFTESKVLKNYPDKSFVEADSGRLKIMVPTVKVMAQNENICVAEVMCPVITIYNSPQDVDFYTSVGRAPGLSNKLLRELIDKHFLEMISAGTVDSDFVKTVIRLVNGLRLGPEDSHERRHIGKLCLKNLKQMPFFDTKESEDYYKFLTDFKYALLGERLQAAIENGVVVKDGEDLLGIFNIPTTFRQVAIECPGRLCETGYMYSYELICKTFAAINEYPMDIQNTLAYYMLHGVVSYKDLECLANNLSKEVMEKIGPDILRRYIIRDLKKGDKFKDFTRIVQRLMFDKIPFTPATVSLKFLSSLLQKDSWDYEHNSTGVMDIFEELLEKDALKAMEYLRSQEQ